MQQKTAIVWFTTNLRVKDNKALYEACSQYSRVIGIYCFNKHLFNTSQFGFKKIEKFRAQFLIESVDNLSKSLRELNIPLYTYFDQPEDKIPVFCKLHQAEALFFQKEFTQEESIVINSVKQKLSKTISLYYYYDQFLYHPDTINFDISNTPEVFTVFRKKIEKYVAIHPELKVTPKEASNWIPVDTKLPSLKDLGFENFEKHQKSAFPFNGGETEAHNRLLHYFYKTKKLQVYKKTRNGLLGIDYSSKFSPWLANGCISAKTIYWEVKKFEKEFGSNQSTYWLIFELIWRDYFKFLSLKHENDLFKVTGIKRVEYTWRQDKDHIYDWIHGQTSNDFVNANMLELKKTGWMSNRGRQNVASYFAKELLLDWRIGAAYFESMLLDYDVHSNYGNWQYVAGVGNDPRNRKFNVQLQAERYDTQGTYRRTWLQSSLF